MKVCAILILMLISIPAFSQQSPHVKDVFAFNLHLSLFNPYLKPLQKNMSPVLVRNHEEINSGCLACDANRYTIYNKNEPVVFIEAGYYISHKALVFAGLNFSSNSSIYLHDIKEYGMESTTSRSEVSISHMGFYPGIEYIITSSDNNIGYYLSARVTFLFNNYRIKQQLLINQYRDLEEITENDKIHDEAENLVQFPGTLPQLSIVNNIDKKKFRIFISGNIALSPSYDIPAFSMVQEGVSRKIDAVSIPSTVLPSVNLGVEFFINKMSRGNTSCY